MNRLVISLVCPALAVSTLIGATPSNQDVERRIQAPRRLLEWRDRTRKSEGDPSEPLRGQRVLVLGRRDDWR
jgi:hypothetical protein